MNYDTENVYAFDISLTDNCNFACTYCVEREYNIPLRMTTDDVVMFTNKIKDLANSDYFRNELKINHIHISFWGGEPTLCIDQMVKFVHELKAIDDIHFSFSFSTNGYDIPDDFLDFIRDVNDFKNMSFSVQVSYDGNPIHRKCRLLKSNKSIDTSIKVRETIKRILDRQIRVDLKGTASFEDFKHIYDAYLDYVELNDTLNINFKYALTLDYSYQTWSTMDESKFNIYADDLRKSLIKIAKHESERNLNGRAPIFIWFDKENTKRICTAGYKYQVINYDGNIYTCHGCVYTPNKDEHYICNFLTDDISTIINKLKELNNLLSDITDHNCVNCTADVCYKCNATKYMYSKKNTYKEKWLDFESNKRECDLYKMVSNIYVAKLLYENNYKLGDN